MSSDKILHKTPHDFLQIMFPLYHLGTPNHKHSVQYLFLISVGNTGPMMSSEHNCFLLVSKQSPSACFKGLSLAGWCKVQLEFSKTRGSQWRRMEEKYLRCTLCHKLGQIHTENKNLRFYQCTLLKSVVFFFNFWKQLNMNQKQFLSNCSKQCLF